MPRASSGRANSLLILNKFGRQESCGRGMVPVIAAAMERGLPVLTAGAPEQRAAFLDFAGDMAQKLPPAAAAAWCRAAARSTAARSSA